MGNKVRTPLKRQAQSGKEARSVDDARAFQLIMSRFDRLEALHADSQEALAKHVETDAKVHRKVDRHALLLNGQLWLCGVGIVAAVGYFFK